MYIDDCTYTRDGRVYRRILLRENVKRNGKNTLKTLANLSHCSEEEIAAVRIALKHKKRLPYLKQLSDGRAETGKIVGPVAVLYQVATRLGIRKALGSSREAKLILWLVICRLLEQGSRLSSVRLANTHAACEILGLASFTEDDLYAAMDWLYRNQARIENRLYKRYQEQDSNSNIFLYDVSSSYLEGDKNELAAWGYNRDKKQGKKQLVFGLLTTGDGEPLSIEGFMGNTKDNRTLESQLKKLRMRFKCKYITLVGDKGMIKSTQIEEIEELEGQHPGSWIKYITSISKPEIRKLMKENVLDYSLFDEKVCEIGDADKVTRYVLRRNPVRAKEMQEGRHSKIQAVQGKIDQANTYLKTHLRAKPETQERGIKTYIEKLNMTHILKITPQQRTLTLSIDQDALREATQLDGCYVIKTNTPKEIIDTETVHARYKDLALVETAFRISKTEYLEVRPIYVRKEERTGAHLFCVMLAYKIFRTLRTAWSDVDLTVEEGTKALATVTTVVVTIGDTKLCHVPRPSKELQALLTRAHVTIPELLPYSEEKILTRKKLRKNVNI